MNEESKYKEQLPQSNNSSRKKHYDAPRITILKPDQAKGQLFARGPLENQRAASPAAFDARRHPRFKFEVDISIYSRTCNTLRGHTVDLSESGVAAMLRLEVPLGEVVKLDFPLPFGPVTIYAMVRQRNAFRYGFQFLESNAVNEVIRPTCHQLAIEQSPTSNERG